MTFQFQGSKIRFCYHFEPFQSFLAKLIQNGCTVMVRVRHHSSCRNSRRTLFQFLSEGGQGTAFESGLFLAVIMG